MNDIQTVLENHGIEVSGLLRKYKIAGDLDMTTIKKAYDQRGEPFMMELLQIITPTSSFLGLFEGKAKARRAMESNEPLTPKTGQLVTSDQNPVINTLSTSSTTTGKGWTFWDNLLNSVNKTGDTISKVKNDISGQSAEDAALLRSQAQQESSTSNMLYFVAAGFVLLIIIVLIFKK